MKNLTSNTPLERAGSTDVCAWHSGQIRDMQTKSQTLTYAKEIAMNTVSSRNSNRHSAGFIFIVVLASAIGLFMVTAISAIALTPTLSSQAMATVTTAAPSSAYQANRLSGPVVDSTASVTPQSVAPQDGAFNL